MAYRVFKKYPRSIYRGTREVKSQFDYLLVLDFEATCKQYEKQEPQEIIEFPCAALCTKTWNVRSTFHEYVKPRAHPILTPYCTDLTGIVQDMVDNQPHFPEVFKKFHDWLEEHKYLKDGNHSAFVTCGDWDLKVMLTEQCKLDDITVPEHFKSWINLKTTFCDATQYYPRSLKDMFKHLNLEMEGRLHSGLDDVRNMVTVMQELAKNGAEFKVNSAPEKLKKLLEENKLIAGLA